MKVDDIITIRNDLWFSLDDSNLSTTFKRYEEKDCVIAFKICDVYCYMLIKGKIKFFCFKINMDSKKVTRDENLFKLTEDKTLCIVDQNEFGRLKKTLIVEALK
jgi:hypothetical protein